MDRPDGPADILLRRSEGPDDAPFLLTLFAVAQGGPLAALDPPLRDLLLRQSFAGQTATYRARHPQGRFEIVECSGRPVGRIVTDRDVAALTIVDLALLPEWRGRGLGTRLLEDILAEARAAGLPVRLSVAAQNAGARRLYARLGFRAVASSDLALDLAWTPAP
ncbi:GNAT family N-acetyltransferase [Methylobacterium nodulans]|uniref:GCN5-related N-acetyltransferase n=1 Tax=Methylobacterium nodulans (strain LMG 21967 / CNCM I-2342 / ORS 2060) TaxID=460265 RepID=B8IH46_METNO|nr:GNAT family N-acetyltransferase [Methylobacterium nodulans]ACL59738.1 GCN5-related N-acetyltransferase [Methylobacterium nodulans ORS 2060]